MAIGQASGPTPAGFPQNGEFFVRNSGGKQQYFLRVGNDWYYFPAGGTGQEARLLEAMRRVYGTPAVVHPNFDPVAYGLKGKAEQLVGWPNVDAVTGPWVNAPDDAQLWDVGGHLYLAYRDAQGAPILFHVNNPQQLQLHTGHAGPTGGGDTRHRVTRTLTVQQLEAEGGLVAGKSSDLLNVASVQDAFPTYGQGAQGPQLVRDPNGTAWLVDNTARTRHRIDGPGTLSAAVTLYGPVQERDPQGRPIYLTGYTVGVDTATLFGGPGGIEKAVAGQTPLPFNGGFYNPGGVDLGDAAAPVNLYDHARLIYPWMPPELLTAFADAWSDTGDPTLALAATRQHSSYDQYFPGNRRPDGSYRYSEQEYFAVKDGKRQILREYGINPDVFEQQLTASVEGDTSVEEFAARVAKLHDDLLQWGGQGTNGYSYAADWYARNYGLQLNETAILAGFLDPQTGRDILDRRVSIAQIGGSADAFGFARNEARVSRLVGLMDPAEAYNFYAQAGRRLPTFNTLAGRHGAAGDRDTTIEEFEDAFALRDPSEQRKIEQNVRSEQAMFAGQTGFRTTDTGTLPGLRQR